MLSRVAESAYWLSRYIERAENVARFISVNQNLSLGRASGLRTQWSPLIHASGDGDLFNEHYDSSNEASVLDFLLFDDRNPNSIRSCLLSARENARTIRDALSVPMWEAINRFYLRVEEASNSREQTLRQPQRFLDDVIELSHLFVGTTTVTMSHGEAYGFIGLGRMLERCDKTSRILDMKYFILLPKIQDVGTSLDIVQWTALLSSTSALVMYRRKNGRISPGRVTEFLTLDRYFPRAIHYCVLAANRHLHNITGCSLDAYSKESERLLGRLTSDFQYLALEDIMNEGMHEFVDRLQRSLIGIGSQLHKDFFERTSLPTEALQSQIQ